MTQTTINRRRALAVVAAVPAALALGTVTLGQPGELAALISRYRGELDAFCTFAKGRTDAEADAFAAATFEATEQGMMGVPARTSEDALAALDLLIEEGRDQILEVSDEAHLHGALMRAIRDYLAGRVA